MSDCALVYHVLVSPMSFHWRNLIYEGPSLTVSKSKSINNNIIYDVRDLEQF